MNKKKKEKKENSVIKTCKNNH